MCLDFGDRSRTFCIYQNLMLYAKEGNIFTGCEIKLNKKFLNNFSRYLASVKVIKTFQGS